MMNLKKFEEELNFFKELEEKTMYAEYIVACQEMIESVGDLFAYITIDEDGEARICSYADYFHWPEEVHSIGVASLEDVPYILGKKTLPVGVSNPLQVSLARKVLERYKKVMTNPMS